MKIETSDILNLKQTADRAGVTKAMVLYWARVGLLPRDGRNDRSRVKLATTTVAGHRCIVASERRKFLTATGRPQTRRRRKMMTV